MRLNLGCGQDIRAGYLNVDIFPADKTVTRGDFRNLDACGIKDESCDEIVARNILGHIKVSQILGIASHWAKKLKPGGEIFIESPNYNQLGTVMAFDQGNVEEINKAIFGENENMPYVGIYNLYNIENLFKQMGFSTETKALMGNNFVIRVRKPQ